MRRGKLNISSIIFIIIAAFFALLSFAMDQAAVQIEDKVRDQNVKYQNYLFNFTSSKNAQMTLNNISHINSTRAKNLSNTTHFITNVIDKLFFNPNYVKENFSSIENTEDYINNIKRIYIIKFKEHYRYHLEQFTKTSQLVNALNLDEKKYGSYLKLYTKSYVNFLTDYTDYKKPTHIDTIDHNKGFASVEEFEMYYRELVRMREVYYQSFKPIYEIMDLLNVDFIEYGNNLSITNNNLVKLKSYKNFFILLSILFKILGFISLLFLFNSILRKVKVVK